MVVSVEQKSLLVDGGLAEQPSWFISLLSWFGPAYDTQKFISRAKMILGDDGSKPKSVQQPPKKNQGK